MIQHFYTIGPKNSKVLFFLFHGYGANGQNLRTLAQEFSNPTDSLVVCPNAPQSWPLGNNGYQWFDLEHLDPDYLINGTKSILHHTQQFIRDRQKEYSIPWTQTILAGFSQGALVALYMGIGTLDLCTGIIGYSGGLCIKEESILANPEHVSIELVHGKLDSVLPPSYSEQTRTFLQDHGFKVNLHLLPNLDHSIDQRGLEIGIKFINQIKSCVF